MPFQSIGLDAVFGKADFAGGIMCSQKRLLQIFPDALDIETSGASQKTDQGMITDAQRFHGVLNFLSISSNFAVSVRSSARNSMAR
jgi:hypothetical protein